ncbi:hypothetical protein KCP71_23290 [Salmonella enterica subsp. enterica]|nr:hypothetical protein KCP71_23290 [Salmonella enterica subsp. enterica]
MMNQRPGLIPTRREFWLHINSMVGKRGHGNGDDPPRRMRRTLRSHRTGFITGSDASGTPDDFQSAGRR